jgi:hypothetical protein
MRNAHTSNHIVVEKNWKRGQTVEKDDFGVTEHFQSLFDTREKLQKVHQCPIFSVTNALCPVLM